MCFGHQGPVPENHTAFALLNMYLNIIREENDTDFKEDYENNI